MQLSQETDYALRLVEYIAREGGADFVNAKKLSQQSAVPYRFLLRILGKLKRGGILESKMGENGGYRLARPAGEISIGQVVALIEDATSLTRCLKDAGLCNAGRAPGCRVHRALGEIQKRMEDMMGEYTFDSLVS